MWCPRCKKEFDAEMEKCPECGSVLSEKQAFRLDDVDLDKLVWLCDAENDFDADVKISLLRSCGIAAFKRYPGFSAVAKIYCGNTNLGVKLYVGEDELERANEILRSPFDAAEFDEQAYSEGDEE